MTRTWVLLFFFQEADQNQIFVPIFFVELESNPIENEIK